MKEQLISFETDKLARLKGFEESVCRCGGYPDCICANIKPTQSLLQKWLREIHRIEVHVYCNASGWMWELNKAHNTDSFSGGTFIKFSEYSGPNNSGEWDTYEEALEKGLETALNYLK